MSRSPVILVAAALLVAPACTRLYDPCFQPDSVVTDLRILAVRAEPPELLYDPASFVSPAVRIGVLLAGPEMAETPLAVRARLCVPAASGRCPEEAAFVAFGSGDERQPAALSLSVLPALLREALDQDPLRGYAGARVQVEVQVVREARPPLRATKLLLLSPALPGYVPNHGFEIAGLDVLGSFSQERIRQGGSVAVDVADHVGLRPLLAPAPGVAQAAEEYVVRDLLGREEVLRERISYSFFTSPHAQFGAFGTPIANASIADEPAPGEEAPPEGLVRLSALAATFGRVWVVARDGRGGENWLSLQLTASDRRTCVPGSGQCSRLDLGCE